MCCDPIVISSMGRSLLFHVCTTTKKTTTKNQKTKYTNTQVRHIIDGAGGRGRHILNLGHGVLQGTPERSVEVFVNEAKKIR
jgi:hypothetical protein